MNILVDKLDNIIENKIGRVSFNTDFRISIMFELLMQNGALDGKQKLQQALVLYYPDLTEINDLETAIDIILWFYRCGKTELANSKKTDKNTNKNIQIYSYEFDDVYIYSAFLQQYNIDLQDIEYLHWWKFKALLNGLNDNTQFVKIMGYRSIYLGEIKDKEEKKRLKKLKNLYALPDMRTIEQKEADFGKSFW
ncbi:MAG: bacteriophage Gp15 family protein [Bacilli bacterium]